MDALFILSLGSYRLLSSSFSESALNKYVTPTQKAAPVIPILIVVVIKRSVILDIQDQTPFLYLSGALCVWLSFGIIMQAP
ncbi:hypothetical protein ACX03_09180 [Vibrio parahaemolyticus]|nr:hypothetical protein AAW52_01320 [Vibrio diabolicus]KOY46133.1 hypothetical protein ACX03_09180 [Vibrio parahaemolyticus]